MADYKKKKITKKVQLEKAPKENRGESITMRSSKIKHNTDQRDQSKNASLRVIRGKKKEKKLSFILSLSIAIVLVCVYLIILAFHPIGVTEYFSSVFKAVGSGDIFSSESSGKDIISCVRNSDYYYLLTDTKVECINNSGKSISNIDHGFARPVIDVSETRYLVYGQGEQTVKVFNFDKELSSLYYEDPILCADIADNGSFAVATSTDGYDSVVRVYNKKGKLLYEWYSSDGIISSVSLTANGKQILVVTISADDGVFNSKLRLLSFNSADPDKYFEFENDLIYGVYHLSKNDICVISENNLNFINLKNGSTKRETTDYSYKMVDYYENNITVLSSLSANVDINHITVYNKSGEISSFVVDYPVNYMSLISGYLYIQSGSDVYQLNSENEIIRSASVPFDTKVIVPISEKYIVAVGNSSISKILLEDAE